MRGKSPANNDGNRGVEQRSLHTGAKDVRKSLIRGVVPSFVNSSEVFGEFLNKRNQNKAHKHVGNAAVMDNVFYFEDEKCCYHGDTSQTDGQCEQGLRQCQLLLAQVAFAIAVVFLVGRQHFGDEVVVCRHLEVDVGGVGDQ